jgi:heptosyltransferase II
MNIIIIKLGAMGDVLRMTSILRPLREKYKDAKITWVTKKNSVELLETNPLVDEIVLIGDALKGKLKDKEFDLVISFDDEEEACALASQVQSKKLVGAYLKNGKPAYTKDSAPWFDMGLISTYGKAEADKRKAKNVRNYQDIHFSILSLKDSEKYPPILILDAKEMAFGKEFLRKHRIKKGDEVIGFNTGAGGRWQDKKLSVDQTIHLIEKIAKKSKARMILFGGPEEEERNRDIIKKSSVPLIDAGCKNPLRKFAALVDLCDVVVTSDSLAMHIAIALGKKTVALFYPTSAAEIELYSKGKKIIAKGKSYCSYQAVCTHPPKWDVEEIARASLSFL